MFFFWIIVFCISLAVLVKAADFLVASARVMGLALGLSSFIVGVLIVGMGTSLPELIAALAGVIQGIPEIVVAIAVGSNVTNIFLIVGISTLAGRLLTVAKDLIDLDLPLLFSGTALFFVTVSDGVIVFSEAVILIIGYVIYVLYTLYHKEGEDIHDGVWPNIRPKIKTQDIVRFLVGIIGLIVGARYLVNSVVMISDLLQIGTSVITLTAVALGTSLPELIVSARAAYKGHSEVALGNIFGSNMFNILVVTGVPGLFTILPVDTATVRIGIPFLILATVLFVISGISKRIYMWEGAFYILLYILFLSKLFAWF